jgi:tRNA-specific 2-thiouridylase
VAQYGENRCCSLESWQEARQVAKIIGIPIYKVNFGKEFKKIIVDDFLRQYAGGRTPNPCITCNKFIKFDLLLKYARTVFGADYLATGHYAKLEKNEIKKLRNKEIKENAIYTLLRAKDSNKDQTYFLYNLKQNQLKHLLFPLGCYNKEQVRTLAKKIKLPVHDKKDSQEICFVGRSHHDFLKKYLKLKPGKIIDCKTKKVLGSHQGLPLYTVGQRSGIGLSGGPWYVAGFDRKKNHLLVAKSPNQSELLKTELVCSQVNWLAGEPTFPLSCQAQIRYHGQPAPCQVKLAGRKYRVSFKVRQRAIMPGQSVVFYKGDELLGGGIIL